MEKYTIRFAGKSDLDALVGLCELHAIFEQSEYSSVNKKQQLNTHLFTDQPSLFCLVVEYNQKLIGYASYMKQFSTWDAEFYIYMDCLFMEENSRGFGIGEELVERIKKEGIKMRCSHIQWQTPEFNKRAIKFYDRIGAQSKSKMRYFLDVK
ncbi:MAG: GNAT family N-acetyltransferase [Flavobacteriaceae bacterium]|nr:GNAT family N-acetyltransferase [Flavobacteriaceae bacterium]|tara:strand:- start:3 stop:458 length:456 start_codon:yes stop_codon:yes gene_type:complete